MMMMMMMNSLQIQIDMDSLSEMLRSHLKRKEAFMSKIIIISNNHNYGIIMFEFCIDGILDGILYLYGWNFVFVWMEFCIYGWNFVFVWMGFCICMDVIVFPSTTLQCTAALRQSGPDLCRELMKIKTSR